MKSRLTAAIVIGLVLLQLVTIGVVVLTTSLTSNDSLTDHVVGVLESSTGATARLADEYLAVAEQAVVASAGLTAQNLIDFNDADSAERFLLEQVAADSRIDGMYWGRDNGSFVYVSRNDEKTSGGFRTKVISVSEAGRATTLTWRDAGFGLLEQTEDPTDTYDPTERPWYEMATATSGVAWTDPYIFYTARRPGVTASTRIEQGSSVGVIGADIRLAALSGFLSTQRISDAATAFIMTSSGVLVAHPDPELLVSSDPETGALNVVDVALAGDPVTATAAQAAVANGLGSFEFEGLTHLASRDQLATGWEVVVTAPESDFLGDLRQKQRTGLYLVVAVAMLALFVTVPLVVRMMRPLEDLQDRASRDALTGLPNRHTFHQNADPAFRSSQRAKQPVSAVMVDLDHFKRINDTYGHLTGDEILAAVAGRMSTALSQEDLIARFGGDEYAVLLPSVDLTTARTIAARLRRAVTDTPIKTTHGPVYVTVSVGVAATHDEAATLEGLIHDADGAMYRAKRSGRDRIEIATRSVPARKTTNN